MDQVPHAIIETMFGKTTVAVVKFVSSIYKRAAVNREYSNISRYCSNNSDKIIIFIFTLKFRLLFLLSCKIFLRLNVTKYYYKCNSLSKGHLNLLRLQHGIVRYSENVK